MPCTLEVGSGDGVPRVEDTELVDELASESSGGHISINKVAEVEDEGVLGPERKLGCQD